MSPGHDMWEQARDITQTIDLIHARVIAGISEDTSTPALTPRQFTLVIAVRNKGGASIKDLADSLGVTASSASTMVDRLVEAGILTREQNPADRREVIVRVSGELEKMIEPAERSALRFLVDLLEKMGPEYADMWAAVRARIKEVLKLEEGSNTGHERRGQLSDTRTS